jgi:low affinity Fe/Cu permease
MAELFARFARRVSVLTGSPAAFLLMVFLIQNSQNREAQATQLKLDELIRALAQANNRVIDIEDASDEELERLRGRFQRLHEHVGEVMDPRAGAAADAAVVEEPFAADSARAERAQRGRHPRR